MNFPLFLSFFLCFIYAFSQEEIIGNCEEEATFIGDLKQWILENIQIPAEVSECCIVGKVYVRCVIEKDGSLTNISIARGISDCETCNAEAIRLISSMPKWKPGKNCRGEIDRSWCLIPINFTSK